MLSLLQELANTAPGVIDLEDYDDADTWGVLSNKFGSSSNPSEAGDLQ